MKASTSQLRRSSSFSRHAPLALTIIGLTMAFLLAALDVAHAGSSVVIGLLILMLPCLITVACGRKWLPLCLGLAIVLAPTAGRGAVTMIVSALMLTAIVAERIAAEHGKSGCSESRTIPSVILLYGFLTFLGLLRTVLITEPYEPYFSLFAGGGLGQLLHFLSADISAVREALRLFTFSLVAMVLGIWAFRREGLFFWNFIKGLLGGLLLSFSYTVLQVTRPELTSTLNYTPFWASQQRYSGSFSDPNAFGVMLALLIPLLLWVWRKGQLGLGWRRLALILATGLCLLAPFSGSRTFWLGCLLYGALACYLLPSGWRGRLLLLTAGGLVCGGVLLISAHLSGGAGVRGASVPSGIVRLLQAADLSRLEQTFESRLIYARLAQLVFARAPLAGVGLGRFRLESEFAAQRNGRDLGLWWDNANNFYLQVIAEQGLVGAVVLVCLVASFIGIVRYSSLRFVSLVLTVFTLLLLTGPHLHFEEVLYLFTIMLSFAASAVPSTNCARGVSWSNATWSMPVLSLTFLVVLFAPRPLVSRGFYSREYIDGEFLAWTAKRAQINFCSAIEGETGVEDEAKPLFIRTLSPNLGKRPLQVQLQCTSKGAASDSIATRSIDISSSSWQELKLAEWCDLSSQDGTAVSLTVSSLWSPRIGPDGSIRGGGDPRALGLQVKWQSRRFCPL